MKYKKTEELNESVLTATCKKAGIKGRNLKVSVVCPTKDKKWKGLCIRYDYKIDEDKEAYLVKADSIKKGKKETVITATVDLEEFPFRTTHWFIMAYYEENGELFSVYVEFKQPKPSVLLCLEHDNSYKTNDKHIAFCVPMKGGYLAIRYRELSKYDGRFTKIKESIANLWYRMHKDAYKRRRIYLIYEKRCQKAQDNGYHLFRYCMENNMQEYLDAEIYYVIEKDAVDRKKLDKYSSNVLDFMSLKFLCLFMGANLLISPDSRSHAYIWQSQNTLFFQTMKKKKHVFLGHGVLAFKRLNDSFTAKVMKSVLCTVTSDDEADIVCNELGFSRDKIAVTGYARFDALHDTSGDTRDILIMPTHRSWLFGVERKVFTDSEYYSRYMELLNSDQFIGMLEKYDARAYFYIHPSIMEHTDAFTSKSDRIEVVPYGKYSLDDLMMQCKMLITDYSSVAWDMYYMDKPILFYQYDVDKYMDTWGSYVDLNNDMPGERADNFASLMDLVEQNMDNGFKVKPEVEKDRQNRFAHLDDQNSFRICEELRIRNY